ncbi:M23 family metallopeptidase [Flavihumibacter sp. R14]|nr:M23 family metallopeptidase [Flavihumibacter soli]
MSKKKKCVSTIIVTGSQQTRSFQIQTKHLKRLKYYIALFLVSFGLLIGHIYKLSVENRKDKAVNLHLKNEVQKLKVQIPAKNDSNNIEVYIDGIDDKLKNISTYLKKRGVRSFDTGVGGEDQETTLTDKEKVIMYNDYLNSLMKQIQAVPLGYPYFSNQASGYGYRPNPFTNSGREFHGGLDFRGRKGDVVKSTAKGVVIGAGWYRGYGKCVRILHANKYQTLYAHLSKIKVKVGDKVPAGKPIGNIGTTGRSTGPHLHYEVRLNDKPLNPKQFLRI